MSKTTDLSPLRSKVAVQRLGTRLARLVCWHELDRMSVRRGGPGR